MGGAANRERPREEGEGGLRKNVPRDRSARYRGSFHLSGGPAGRAGGREGAGQEGERGGEGKGKKVRTQGRKEEGKRVRREIT